jgi:plastocyanin
MFAAGALFGLDLDAFAIFLIVPAVVAVVAAFLVVRFGTWAKIVGAVVALLVGFLLWWTAFGLQSPQSFFDFLPGLLVVPGVLIAIVSGIASVVAKRRGRFSERATGGERTWIRAITGVVALLAVLSGILTATGRSSADQATADASVLAKDFEFDQLEYTVAGGSSVFVRNDDPFLHTFTIDELTIDEVLTPGDEVLITIPSKPGTYIMYCTPHSDPDDPEVPKSLTSDDDEGDMAARFIVT